MIERCGWCWACSGGEAALPHELLDEAVVLGDWVTAAVAEEVAAGVADVAERARVTVEQGDGGERRAHAPQLGVAAALSKTAALAASTASSSAARRAKAASRASMAVALATSPARWPPMPSATA